VNKWVTHPNLYTLARSSHTRLSRNRRNQYVRIFQTYSKHHMCFRQATNICRSASTEVKFMVANAFDSPLQIRRLLLCPITTTTACSTMPSKSIKGKTHEQIENCASNRDIRQGLSKGRLPLIIFIRKDLNKIQFQKRRDIGIIFFKQPAYIMSRSCLIRLLDWITF